MRRTSLVVLGFAALAMAGACDERANPLVGTVGDPSGGSSTFNVTPPTLSLTPGQTAQLTLNTTRAIGPYTWSTNQAGVASVSQTGLVTAIGTGSATVTVTAAGDATVSARSVITVQPGTP
ncbi:MAG: Ig-like domain-containing protein [Gemmatimonadaceae bacterium]|nr:Ig-like domain-containing protein [Gemmatimonadaceae bacterium]